VHTVVHTRAELHDALRPAPGLRVVEVPVRRDERRDLHERLRTAVANAVRGLDGAPD
jgi:2-succinyl-5-enolpyruvyl-6-hydroxy-3-cyclohexene-1-carboxylate synthase